MSKTILKRTEHLWEDVTLDQIDDILNKAIESGADYEQWEGTLNDYYIVEGMGNVSIDEQDPTEYIIIFPIFRSSWSNDLFMLRTNEEKVMEYFRNLFIKELSYEEE